MKLNIKALAATALVGLSLVSCNNDFDEDGATITYADKLELSSWSREYTPATDPSYVINLYVDEQGDTLADVSIFNPVTELSNVLSAGKVKYDAKTGVTSVEYAESMYGTPARVTLATSNDKTKQIVNIYTANKGKYTEKDRFAAVKTDTISVLGQWSIGNGEDVSFYNNGKAVFTQNGEVVDECNYTFDGKAGSCTRTSGKVYNFAMNANRQMQTTIDGTVYNSLHVPVEYVNDWAQVGTGTYYAWLFEGGASGRTIEYSACRGEYRIDMSWFPLMFGGSAIDGQYVVFNWNKRTGAVSMSSDTKFDTGYAYQTYGNVFGSPSGAGMKYEDGVFSFGISYTIPGVGGFGSNYDTFTLDSQE